MNLREQITEDMKVALRAKDSARLGAVRLLLAAIKQREVDERTTLGDTEVIGVIEKMLKQRRDSISQYRSAGRDDLADKEQFEVSVLQAYMPQALSEAEIAAAIDAAIAATGAAGVRDLGKVMAAVKPMVVGRADMGKVSQLIKARLSV